MGWGSKSKLLAREAQQMRARIGTTKHEGTKEGTRRGRRTPLIELPGVIAVVSGDRTTYPQFVGSLATIQAPGGTKFCMEFAGGGGVAMARNKCVRVARELGAAWIWFIDDDHGFRMDILSRLLRHNVDIVVPTVMGRKPPHDWVAWEHFPIPDDATDAQLVDLCDQYSGPPKIRAGQTGLVELGHCGAAGSLVAIEVFNAMPSPWYEFGQFGGDSAGEDTVLALKARLLGFRVWCDLDTPMSHLAPAAVWPKRDGDRMGHVLEMDSTRRAARMAASAIDDTCCGACGKEL